MDGIAGRRDLQTHNNRHVLTDQTLSLLQDSGWYNVLYGSQGFSSYGYQGGCTFATGSFQQALASPEAARYLCAATDATRLYCEHDHSVSGICSAPSASDGFVRVVEVAVDANPSIVNCQGFFRGERCLEELGQTFTTCEAMSCSAAGTVLINGQPCDQTRFNCPNDVEMCINPGYLTCVGQPLNDCNGNGDCLQGRCFCHGGFGGADCSVPLCINSCPDGSPCPASGFCGVPVCGAFTTGATDRGTPCNNAPLVTPPPTVDPPVDPPPVDPPVVPPTSPGRGRSRTSPPPSGGGGGGRGRRSGQLSGNSGTSRFTFTV